LKRQGRFSHAVAAAAVALKLALGENIPNHVASCCGPINSFQSPTRIAPVASGDGGGGGGGGTGVVEKLIVTFEPGCRFKEPMLNGRIWNIVSGQPLQQPAQPEPAWLGPMCAMLMAKPFIVKAPTFEPFDGRPIAFRSAVFNQK
jgi:hypothetical protein